ncbi:MAG: cytochrome c-type biogenesis protein [Acidobacteriaceae bacterium]
MSFQTCSRSLLRITQLLLLVMLVIAAYGGAAGAGDTDSGSRFDKLGHRIMCPCGCNELLAECNHVGCPDSDSMRNQLMASIQRGDDDNTIFHAFEAQYGPPVLAAPMFTRFNHLAWIMPPLVLLLGFGAVLLVVRKWRLRTVAMPATPQTPAYVAMRDRIRKETEL